MNKLKICLLICKSILLKLTNTILTLFRKIIEKNILNLLIANTLKLMRLPIMNTQKSFIIKMVTKIKW